MLPTADKNLERSDLKSVRPKTPSLRGDPCLYFTQSTVKPRKEDLVVKKSVCCWFLNKGCKLKNQGGRFLIWFLIMKVIFMSLTVINHFVAKKTIVN